MNTYMCEKEIKAALQTETAGEECRSRVEQLLQRLVLPQIRHLPNTNGGD